MKAKCFLERYFFEGLSRDKLFSYEMLGLDQRVCKLDVMLLQMNEIEVIRERKS